MRRSIHAAGALVLLLIAGGARADGSSVRAQSGPAAANGLGAGPQPIVAADRSHSVLHGGGAVGYSKSCPDTVFLYGGPGSLVGRFQTEDLQPDWQGWASVDLTEDLFSIGENHWHISTFNAANLGERPPYWQGSYLEATPNHAMWDGVPAGTPGMHTAPGYGHRWHDQLDLRVQVTNPSAATTLAWNFVFNHDSEPGYDFFLVQWESAGGMRELANFSGDNRDSNGTFRVPAEFSAVLVAAPGDYSGVAHDEIHLRLVFDSDGAWSDQDGLFPTDGAAQVDNIQVAGDNGVGLHQATFENDDTGGWTPVPREFVGDFTKLMPLLTDLDACRENPTPQIVFLDDGTPPLNDPLGRSVGPSYSPTWSYGAAGGFVPSYTGGLTHGAASLHNAAFSPPISWNGPGTCDDGLVSGAFLRYDVYQHLPAQNGIYHFWQVRSQSTSSGWSSWRNRNLVYHDGGTPGYSTRQVEIGDLLFATRTWLQVRLGVVDLAATFGLPGNDATPAPYFDNVSVARHNAPQTPSITARALDLFQDAFPASGEADCLTGQLAALAIRLDMARDIRTGHAAMQAGDSIVVNVVNLGGSWPFEPPRLEFLLEGNPAFASARAGAFGGLGAVQIRPNVWRGSVAGTRILATDQFRFDLPDGSPGIFFPGDELRYFIRASNTAGESRLPADTTGFFGGGEYDRMFTVHGLPSVRIDTAPDPDVCVQPPILVWNDLEQIGDAAGLVAALRQNGLVEGIDFDAYTTRSPSSLASNGLGGVHGATSAQLSGYSCLLYDAGSLGAALISDGSAANGNDKGDDVGVLSGWFGQPGHRYAAYWGDDIAAGLTGGGTGYRSTFMGVLLQSPDVRSAIGGQTAPRVGPSAAASGLGFGLDFIAFGGCLSLNAFDEIAPVPGAVTLHQFSSPSGSGGGYAPAASVYYARQETVGETTYDRISVTFPYGFAYVQDATDGSGGGGGRSARANLLRELLVAFGHGARLDQQVVAADAIAARRLTVAQNRPNPFNPSTEIAFTAPARGKVAVRIYNLRGELVTTLLNDEVDAGQGSVIWNGVDGRGRSVASGIYLYQVDGFGQSITRKMAIVK